jgi:hypothetical protein
MRLSPSFTPPTTPQLAISPENNKSIANYSPHQRSGFSQGELNNLRTLIENPSMMALMTGEARENLLNRLDFYLKKLNNLKNNTEGKLKRYKTLLIEPVTLDISRIAEKSGIKLDEAEARYDSFLKFIQELVGYQERPYSQWVDIAINNRIEQCEALIKNLSS